jgi:MBG domain (YGX type)/PKD domain/Bacterial Ig-like domain (group 1)/Bacterial Ig-like domain (group 3)
MRRILTIMLVLTLSVGSIAGLFATPVAARVYSVQPTNEDGGPPTDQFTTADPIFAIFRADVEGGEICVVPEGHPDDKRYCKIIANYVGTGWWLIAKGLPAGRYQLLAHDPGYSFLSVPFVVTDCVGTDCAERRRMSDEVVVGWKHAAKEQLERLHVVETSIKIGEIGDAFNTARDLGRDLLPDPINRRYTGWVATAALAGGYGAIAFAVFELGQIGVPTSLEGAFLALAAEVTEGTRRMYEDIVKDPPDFDYTTVAAPAFTDWPSTGDALHDRVVRTFERQRAFGRAQLKAYERYLGAAADGQEVYVRMQAQAVADYGEALAAEMRESAAAMRAWGAQLDPNLPAVTQEHLDGTMAVYERVRTSGFTQEELDQLTAAGLGAAEIAQVRAAFDEDISQTPVGVPMRDTLARAADALEAAAPSILTFSSEAAWVAGGRAPEAISIVPASASLQTGSTHNVSSAVTDARNEPVTGVSVTLKVTGANPATLTATTDAGGVATFSYVGNNPGVDNLSATTGTATSNNATVNWSVGPVNTAPSVVDSFSTALEEGGGGQILFYFTDADTQDTHTAVIDWGDGSPSVTFPSSDGTSGYIVDNNGSGFVAGNHVYAENGVYEVRVAVIDNHGGVGTRALSATVRNLAPVLGGITLEEVNGEIVFKGDFTDPGVRDTHTAEINWGDGTSGPATVTETGGSGSASGRHVYSGSGNYAIALTLSDDDGGTASRSVRFTMGNGGVGNSPPSLQLSNYITYEGGGSFSAYFTDPDSLDSHTAVIDWGDGSPLEDLFVREHANGLREIFRNHVYVDNGTFTIKVTLNDNHGGSVSGVAPMNVQNAEPRVTFVFPSSRLVAPGDTITVRADFSDTGVRDTHTAIWDWGDGTTTVADFTEANGFGQASGSHAYTTPGVYTISLIVTDNDGATGVGTTGEPVGVYAATIIAGSIKPVVTETGRISVSTSGLGMTGQAGTLKVKKPTGATVRRAYLASATRGLFRYLLRPGDVKLDGVDATWSIVTPSGIGSFNFWGEVTHVVKAKLDSAPAGRVDISLREGIPTGVDSIEGEVLVVIFDDPNQTTDNTVALLFGAQQTAGDTFALRFAQPLDLSDPNFALTMSLGISYGYQNESGQQYSVIDINGQRMTTSAGGQDDGEVANGALLTVGDLDDSPANPTDPYALPRDPRADDELYDLRPFVKAGDTELTVATSNPSNDDNIFFAAFFLQDTAAVVGEGVVLTPLSAAYEVGAQHTLTATAQDAQGHLLQGRNVTFEILSGPHAGLTNTVATNAQGLAQFTYAGSQAGTDTIVARFINSEGKTQASNTVTAEWEATAIAPTMLTVSPASGTYGGMTGLSARLTAGGSPLSGKDVSFSFNGTTLGAATTDADGVATIPNVSLAGINAGTHSNSIVAHFAGDTSYAASNGMADLTVGKAMPQIAWNNPTDVPYGTALGNTQLNAVASVPGTLNYAPAAGTILHAGNNQNLHVDFTPTDTTNYNTVSKDVSINVTKAPLIVIADDKSKVYGTVNPPLTARYNGFVNREDASVLGGRLSLGTTATMGSPVGSYPITASGLTSSNYAITFVNGQLTVTKTVLTITADNKSRIYNTVNPPLTFKLSGFVNGDTAATAFTGSPSLATSARTSSNAGAYPITATIGTLSSNNYSFTFISGKLTVNRAPTITVTNGQMFANKGAGVLTASLLDVNSLPIVNRTIRLTLGTRPCAQTCSATTDAAGKANCQIKRVMQPLGPGTVSASFVGDNNYLPSSSNAQTLIFAYPAGVTGGSFVISDRNAVVGKQVTFWGAQWAKLNPLIGGAAPSSFKGFANQTSTSPATCGGKWRTSPGNSSGPPRSIPAYMAVIVSSSITKSGSTITGNVPQIVIVKTNPGYNSKSGHAGTGTVVAVWCH